MLQKFNGIVLKARAYGESNQIIHVLSDTHGKVAMMARGSKKPNSRLRAVTEPFTEAQFICYGGSGMATLSQGDIFNAHRHISADLLKTAYAAYWFELIERLLPEKEPQPALYQLLSRLLSQLEVGKNAEVLTRIWELRIMAVSGYQPVFSHCVHCRATANLTRMSASQGGFLCENCATHDPQAVTITAAVARILPMLQTISIDRLGQVQIKTETERQLRQIMYAFMQQYIDIEWKTRAILERLRD